MTSPPKRPPDLLRSMRARFPDWVIQVEAGIATAVQHPAQSSVHVIVGPTLRELDTKLTRRKHRQASGR
jgi:hypothetical protein